MSQLISVQKIAAREITAENFSPYGQVIFTTPDYKRYDDKDALLNLTNGTPRFYIMRLEKPGRKFRKITRHVLCTQCLGSLAGKEWLIAVAPPSESNKPDLENLAAFRVPGNCFIKLEAGTWHAGPHFEEEFIDFYNLELSDTNEADHYSHDFLKSHDLELEIVCSDRFSD